MTIQELRKETFSEVAGDIGKPLIIVTALSAVFFFIAPFLAAFLWLFVLASLLIGSGIAISMASALARAPVAVEELKDLITRQQAFLRNHETMTDALLADLTQDYRYLSISEVSRIGQAVVVRVYVSSDVFRFQVRVDKDSAEVVGRNNIIHSRVAPMLEEIGVVIPWRENTEPELDQPKLA